LTIFTVPIVLGGGKKLWAQQGRNPYEDMPLGGRRGPRWEKLFQGRGRARRPERG
jgi:hypothetical protein